MDNLNLIDLLFYMEKYKYIFIFLIFLIVFYFKLKKNIKLFKKIIYLQIFYILFIYTNNFKFSIFHIFKWLALN